MIDSRTTAGLGVLIGLTLVAGGGGSVEAGGADAAADPKAVSYNADVAPILFRRCASCHRPGEVAPFSLLDYRDASRRANLIREVVEGRTMPPWKAEPIPGGYLDERRLTDEEIATIARWVEADAPEGDPADLPPRPEFVTGWQFGEPDLVLTMDEPYTLAAEGPDEYRCFVIPVEVPEGRTIRAVEYRPGNRKIVHHAVLSTLPHKTAQAKLAEGDGKSFLSGLAPPGRLLPGPLAFWTPGMTPRPLPTGLAASWPKGSDLVLQLHLHPSGKPETERSSIGLFFTDEAPRARLDMMVISNPKIAIPPGEADHVVRASATLKTDAEIYGVFPHMHLIGRTVELTARLPDGTSRPLVAIGDWDFDWQHYYQFATPPILPAGTRLEGRWSYDNSEGNPANPSRPPKRVGFGEQTTDEMAIVILDLLPVGKARKQADARPRPGPGEGPERSRSAP